MIDDSLLKKGNILVAVYLDIAKCSDNTFEGFPKNYIIFISNGKPSYLRYRTTAIGHFIIPTMVCIDLGNRLSLCTNIGYAEHYEKKKQHQTTLIRKPTFNEMCEFMDILKENGYYFDKKNKILRNLKE